MKSLIALTGRKGSGKSTLASLLVEHHQYVRIPITGALKAMVRELLRYQNADNYEINQYLDGAWKEESCPYLDGVSPRHAMQTLGTEWRNLISRDLWINIWERTAMSHEKIVVDDLRFLHEAERIRRFAGSFIIQIFRPSLVTTNLDLHLSETEMEKIQPDFTVANDTTPEAMLKELAYGLGNCLDPVE